MAGSTLFKGLVGTELVTKVMHMVRGGLQLVLQRVDKPLVVKVTFLNSYPFMKPHMQCDHKFTGHFYLQTATQKNLASRPAAFPT